MSDKFLVLLGPTAIGKTATAIELAQRMDAEILSADSMQIYQGMSIGTAKPSASELQKVKHHMVGTVPVSKRYDVHQFLEEAGTHLTESREKGKQMLITGGTGLYLRALIQGVISDSGLPSRIREELEQEYQSCGIEGLRLELEKVDPEKYHQLPAGDHRRIIRALEYFRQHGKPLSEAQIQWQCPVNASWVLVGLFMERQKLYKRINQRVDQMMTEGLVQEVKALMVLNLPQKSTCWQAIGYRQIRQALMNQISMDEAVDLVKRDTRRLAKRQMTWFKKVPGICWFEAFDPSSVAESILAEYPEFRKA